MSLGISAGTWLAAGATVAGGAIAAGGAKSAASTTAGAQNYATQVSERQYDQTRTDYLPWLEAGERGLAEYEEVGAQPSRILEGDYIPAVDPFKFGAEEFEQYKDPGYEFRLEEGERGVNRALASMGKLGSGNRLRALMDLNQQTASEEFGAARGRALSDYAANVLAPYERGVAAYGRAYGAEGDYINRLAALSNIGQTAVEGVTRATPNLSPTIVGAGEASAAGQLGTTGAWSSALADLGRQWQDSQKPDYSNAWRDYGGYADSWRGYGY